MRSCRGRRSSERPPGRQTSINCGSAAASGAAGAAASVAAASAAYLFNVLPSLTGLPATELFERLKSHFEAAVAAYQNGLAGWAWPEPSRN